MSDFINTIDVLGDEAVIDSFIMKTITEFSDNKLTEVRGTAFQECTALTSVNLPEVKSGVKFAGCTSLKTVNLPKVEAIPNYCFENANAITELTLPRLTRVPYGGLKQMKSCKLIDLPCVTYIDQYGFQDDRALESVILRSETICTLNNVNAFQSTNINSGTVYIYVPAALVESYKVATNWSNYADQFRAIEDYTVDGTVMGELIGQMLYSA